MTTRSRFRFGAGKRTRRLVSFSSSFSTWLSRRRRAAIFNQLSVAAKERRKSWLSLSLCVRSSEKKKGTRGGEEVDSWGRMENAVSTFLFLTVPPLTLLFDFKATLRCRESVDFSRLFLSGRESAVEVERKKTPAGREKKNTVPLFFPSLLSSTQIPHFPRPSTDVRAPHDFCRHQTVPRLPAPGRLRGEHPGRGIGGEVEEELVRSSSALANDRSFCKRSSRRGIDVKRPADCASFSLLP